MLKKTAVHVGTLAAVLMLGACAMNQQPAPVVEGASSPTDTTSTVANSNPYGAAPYNPNTAGASVSGRPYTPPPTTSGTGTYIPSYAPVDIHAATHTVIRGDTVFNISKRYQINQADLRAWNNLGEDNTISVGQVLRVKPAGYVAPSRSTTTATRPTPYTPPPTTAPVDTASSKPVTPPPAANNVVSTDNTRTVAGITWQRPTAGNVIAQFNNSNKGVDIAGTSGQAVVAAADGKVVYAGSGLRGYGNLVIVQHNPTYLTAYGHNESLLVSEGQMVKRGQTIALMGKTDADRVKLHFEVRQDGKPVNPNNFVAF